MRRTKARRYFLKRVLWHWEVWYAYQDGRVDPASGASEWFASTGRFLRRINAERVRADLWRHYNDGYFNAEAD